ncbi:MAG: GTPase Era [Candidatus Cyclobacteriaceae bacterium M3_2C_046]
MSELSHKAGFVNIIGKPNVGKSTLMNSLVGERLSIITSKAQTTRHRIMGIINNPDFQIIYSDTPGIITPAYQLQKNMMNFVYSSLEDADIVIFMTDIYEKYLPEEVSFNQILQKVHQSGLPVLLLINKIDQAKPGQVEEKMAFWNNIVKAREVIPVSALNQFNLEKVLQSILDLLPVHPPYYDKEELTDRPERFFVAEIIREKIFMHYKKEVPYSTEVAVLEFKEAEDIIRIRVEIFVERKTQRAIIIGKNGEAIKKVGIEARQDLEKFFNKQVYLEQYVRVEPDWRKKLSKLNKFGY